MLAVCTQNPAAAWFSPINRFVQAKCAQTCSFKTHGLTGTGNVRWRLSGDFHVLGGRTTRSSSDEKPKRAYVNAVDKRASILWLIPLLVCLRPTENAKQGLGREGITLRW